MRRLIFLAAFLAITATADATIYYAVFPNENQARNKMQDINELFGVVDAQGNCLWVTCAVLPLISHPSNGKWAIVIDTEDQSTSGMLAADVTWRGRVVNVYDEILTAVEKGALFDQATMDAGGWFPAVTS